MRGKKQQALLQQLFETGPSSVTELKALGFTQKQLDTLQDKAYITKFVQSLPDWREHPLQFGEKPRLNQEQARVCAVINQQVGYCTFLLEGVTGSGKTEVYLQCIESILAQGKQVLVLVPEIGLTPQTINRFRRRFTDLPIGLWHSNLTDNERLHIWRQTQTGDVAIVIATRSGIFLPFVRLGMIVVDEEHDHSFKQQSGFRYHARDLAIYRGAQSKIPVLLGSATPALESLQQALQGKYRHLSLTQRAQTKVDNRYQLVDMRAKSHQAGIAESSLAAIKAVLSRDKQVMVFLNRRGFSPTLICHECGWLSQCHRCSANATYHQSLKKMICHHCGYTAAVPRQCSDCGSTQIMPTGQGTEQVEAVLAEHFKDYPVTRIDRDTTARKGSLEAALEIVNQGGARILVGTQMLAKGHHFADVNLVLILDVDSGLYASDFRATEHLAQLITQVSGRAGRSGEAGLILLQTHFPEHPLLQDLVNNGYQHFARYALKEREEVTLPPFAHMALLRAESTKAQNAYDFLADLVPADPFPGIQLMGPLPAPMERVAGKYRFQLHIQASQRKALHQYMTQLIDYVVHHHSLTSRVRWSVDIDPIDTY